MKNKILLTQQKNIDETLVASHTCTLQHSSTILKDLYKDLLFFISKVANFFKSWQPCF